MSIYSMVENLKLKRDFNLEIYSYEILQGEASDIYKVYKEG